MRIAFIVIGNSRRSNYLNGHTLRYGKGGGSGTDSSTIIIAEHLAKQGHEVVFVQDKLEPQLEQQYASQGIIFTPGQEVNGVKYTYKDFGGIENKEFDILVSSLWFHEYNELPIKVTKGLIYWSHMQWIYGIGEIIEYCVKNGLKLSFVNISEWERKMNQGVIDFAKNRIPSLIQTTIPNPIMDDIIEEVLNENIERKRHKFVFHAVWARGGDVAVNAVRQLPYEDKEFHAFDYLMATHPHPDSFFRKHNGVDKKTLFRHIAESDYFIYPLYTPYKDVHKDTFSCVVAEAIALGCIVLTYPLGAVPDNFNDYCVWLDFPPDTNPQQMQVEQLSKDDNGKFQYTQNIIDKITYLENNPDVKEKLRQGGKEYILNRFNLNTIGKMWDELLKNF
jgi:hypothetical protein